MQDHSALGRALKAAEDACTVASLLEAETQTLDGPFRSSQPPQPEGDSTDLEVLKPVIDPLPADRSGGICLGDQRRYETVVRGGTLVFGSRTDQE